MDRAVAVALGSSLGDRRGTIAEAAARIGRLLAGFQLSDLIETAPVGEGTHGDPPFLNAAGIGYSSAPAGAILAALQTIEQDLGRTRSRPNGPRTIDIDLILVGGEIHDEPSLVVPHPRFRERRFVLEPLATIAPDLRDPISGLTVSELLRRLDDRG